MFTKKAKEKMLFALARSVYDVQTTFKSETKEGDTIMALQHHYDHKGNLLFAIDNVPYKRSPHGIWVQQIPVTIDLGAMP